MSSFVLGEGRFDPVQWDDQSQFWNQPLSYFNDGTTEWPSEVDQSTPLPISSSRSFGIVLSDTAYDSTMDKDHEVVTDPVATGDEQIVEQHKSTRTAIRKGRGRPKLELDDPQSLKERRRAQIRLAQQAYRHRKEASVTSIQKENEVLKSRLDKLQVSFSQLLSIALEANLPPTQSKLVQSLVEVNEQQSEAQSVDKANDVSCRGTEYDKHQSGPLNGQNSSMDTSNSFRRSPRVISSPYVSPLEQMSLAIIPFALRLRMEGLKHGYKLIQDPKASFQALRQTFQHHIFSETRESILRRIYQQLDQTIKYIHWVSEIGSRQKMVDGAFWEPNKVLNPQLEGPSPTFLGTTEYHSISELEPTNEEVLLDDGQLYVYAGKVEKHLLERGLNFTAEPHFISFPAGSKVGLAAAPTMFDELRGNRELKLSVHELTKNLLNNGSCLDMGPGFRQKEIDKALRLTMIESI